MRRMLALLTACTVATLAPAWASEPEAALDGERRTRHQYDGVLSGELAVGQETVIASSEPPQAVECTETTCDTTVFQLRLPKGRQTGKLVVSARFSDYFVREVSHRNVHVVLYDRLNRVLASAVPTQPEARLRLPADTDRYLEARYADVVLVESRLPAGTYYVRLFNRSLPLSFEATATWTANAPMRQR